MNLEFHLRIVGVLLLALVALNLYVPVHFGWKRELAGLSLFTRQVFMVHASFIYLLLLLMAALLLGYAPALLEPTPLARALLIGLVIFWGARLLTQWCVYDWRLWRGQRLHTAVHLTFTGLWLYFVGVFVAALW